MAAVGRLRRGIAFTLVEMLVVIVIISLLASMLMPSLQKAVSSARSMSCLNNLRQCGLLASVYSEQNNGFFLVKKQTGASGWGYQVYLEGLLNSGMDMLNCPEAEFPSPAPSDYLRMRYYTYGANVSATCDGKLVTSARVEMTEDGVVQTYLNFRRISKPSQFLLMAETKRRTGTDKTPYALFTSTGTGVGRVYFLHDQRTLNSLFADGHVSAIDYKALTEVFHPDVAVVYDSSEIW